MKQEFITKTYVNAKTKETVNTKYRVDSDFVPSNRKEICIEFVINYCETNNHDEWLTNEFEEKITKEKVNKQTKETYSIQVERTNHEVIADFIEKFFPELVSTKNKLSPREEFLKRQKAKKNK